MSIFRIGDHVVVLDGMSMLFYVAVIENILPNENLLRIHYLCLNTNFDECITYRFLSNSTPFQWL